MNQSHYGTFRRYSTLVHTRFTDLSKRRYVSPYDIALVYAGLGDKDQAFSWLEKAYKEPSTWLILLNMDQLWNPVRDDPRFKDLLHRMNFQGDNDAHNIGGS